MRQLRSILVAFPLMALAALSLQIGAGALGGHLCRGVALAAASACGQVCCASEREHAETVVRHPVGPEHGPFDSPDSECCIRASLVLMAPGCSATVRPVTEAPQWDLVAAPLKIGEGPSGRITRRCAELPRPPAALALVSFAILNI